MNAATSSPQGRGLDLLAAHCASLERLLGERQAPPALERLEALVGCELAHTLVSALSLSSPGSRARDQRFAA
jgi:hypothetical protein